MCDHAIFETYFILFHVFLGIFSIQLMFRSQSIEIKRVLLYLQLPVNNIVFQAFHCEMNFFNQLGRAKGAEPIKACPT